MKVIRTETKVKSCAKCQHGNCYDQGRKYCELIREMGYLGSITQYVEKQEFDPLCPLPDYIDIDSLVQIEKLARELVYVLEKLTLAEMQDKSKPWSKEGFLIAYRENVCAWLTTVDRVLTKARALLDPKPEVTDVS